MRSMRRPRADLTIAMGLAATLLTGLAVAGLIPGGTGKSDCYFELDVDAVTDPSDIVKNHKKITCTDGDGCDAGPCGDGACDLQVRVCWNQTDPNVPNCTPPSGLDRLRVKGKLNVEIPGLLEGSSCADQFVQAHVQTKKNGRKPGKLVLHAMAKAAKGTKPRTDKDTFTLICNPRSESCGATQCSREATGLPNEIALEVPSIGTDLDTGYTGQSHNFTIVQGAKLDYCLSGCDASANPACTGQGATGPGTPNGRTFGAPLPLFSVGVPVCLVNRFKDATITSTVNLQSGAISAPVNLLTDVYVRLGKLDLVCPRCDGGKCKGGKNDGAPCTVTGTVSVVGSQPTQYNLSSSCLPEGTPTGTLDIALPLQTATATSAPGRCPGQTADDACPSNGVCNVDCSATTPALGGINQLCCSAGNALPCFPTANAGTYTRTGSPLPVTPAWPDPTYPKSSNGGAARLVATFCVPATRDATVDGLSGLPGPGAIIVPVMETVTAQQ